MTSIEHAPITTAPAPDLEHFNDVFDHFESEEATPNPKEQMLLYDSTVREYNPEILVNPVVADRVDALQDEGFGVIINGNHRRFEDQYIIAAAIARGALGQIIKTRPMRIPAKSPYFDNEYFREFLKKCGAFPTFRKKDLVELDDFKGKNDRRLEILHEAGSRWTRLCVNLLHRRQTITMFGSGERENISRQGDVQKIKDGIGNIVRTAADEHLPVAVINAGLVYEADDPKKARLYIAPPIVGLKGTTEEIVTQIHGRLEKGVGIAAGLAPLPEGTEILHPIDFKKAS